MNTEPRNAEDELNCAEEILDGYAAHLDLEKTDFDCIGDYIDAVCKKLKEDADRWAAVRNGWTNVKVDFANSTVNPMKRMVLTVDFTKKSPTDFRFVERDFDQAVKYWAGVKWIGGRAVTHWMDDRGLVVTDDFLRFSDRSTSDYQAAYNIPCCLGPRGKIIKLI